MNIVERITVSDELTKCDKIVKLWAVVMINYREPLGEEAWTAMRALTDVETTHAIAMLTGYAIGAQLVELNLYYLDELLNENGDW